MILLISVIMPGCKNESSDSDSTVAQSGSDSPVDIGPDGVPIAELSDAGWPHTTKKHSGEFVYRAPDGSETISDLGDNTVAHLNNTHNKGMPDELEYSLHFIRHKNGNDIYQVNWSWISGANSREEHSSSGHAYSGTDQVDIATPNHGEFVIRPKSN